MAELRVIELDSPPADFLPGEPEGAAFHRAFQEARIPRFECRYLAIFENGIRIAIVPYFLGTFCLGTMLAGGLVKRCLSRIRFRYACVGHPSTDIGLIDGAVRADLLAAVNATLQTKAPLIAYKGFTAGLPLPGFFSVHGLPVCALNIEGDYLAMFNEHRRNDFRHKLRAAAALRCETYAALPDHLLTPVYQLYLDTLSHAQIRFEELTPKYFRQVAGLGSFHLYFEEDRLIGFLQLLTNGDKANMKYMGMDHQRNRQYYLYFVMCLRAIETCVKAGCTHIELGVSSYHAKQLMGCQLTETRIYYRHGHPIIHWLLGKCKFLLEPTTAELR
ncbi:MAG: GNAT family N-acetyltransferase [Gallionella sp.]|nr:GNAT family N-acetyltransferase [Gallionella sp.]MDD4946781.1 GNAT family N-acetyltransferase [Gallionella sp.]MDD5613334.1 GNAT family N-acetyltransferase [Gallionella sp.]